jgi:putative membrane protein
MGEWHPEVLAGLAGLGILYGWLARTRGEPLPPARALAAAGGLLVLAGALNGPLHDLSERYLFSAHMVQHVLLTLVAPPLLLLGVAPGMLTPLLRAPGSATVFAWLTRPLVASGLYNLALVAWHLPRLYNTALEHHGLHILQHLTFITTATLAWWPIVAPEPSLPRPAYGVQMLYLFALGLPMTAIAAFVTFAEEPLYPFYARAPRVVGLSPLEDQQLGGVIMWIPAALIPLGAFSAVFFKWAANDEE